MAQEFSDKERSVALMMGYAKIMAFPEEEFQLEIPVTEEESPDIQRAYALGKELGAKALAARSKNV